MNSNSDATARPGTIPGRLAFCFGLALWAALSWRLLPYDFADICYLFSLEDGAVLNQEWVHPAFVPMLAVLRAGLALFGLGAKMLIPGQALNLALACAALALLFIVLERLCRDSWAAAAGSLLLAFCGGFWDGCLRMTPYSPAAACTLLCAGSLLGARPRLASRRYALAGAAAGLAAGFHMAALSLIPVGLLAAHLEGREVPRLRLAGGFLAGFAAALLAAYAAFVVRSGWSLTWFNLAHSPFWSLFQEVEQIPESSLYTSHSLLRQVREFSETLRVQARPLLAAALAGAALTVVLGRGRLWLEGQAARALALASACAAAFSLFFIINNSHNGFIFSAVLLLPAVAALSAAGLGLWRWPFLAACLLATGFSAARGLEHGPDQDALLAEVRFLDRLLRPGDVLLVPGGPFPELTYLRHLDLLRVGAGGPKDSEIPLVEGDRLAAAVTSFLAQGRRVFFAPGDVEARFTGDVGTQKRRQIFAAAGDAGRRREDVAAVRKRLSASSRWQCGLVSALGETYCEVLPKRRLPRRAAAAPAPAAPQACPALAQAGDDPWAALWLAKKARYLERWLADSPGDDWALRERARLCAAVGR
ncbi:MAG: hypothetical protein PHU21_02060 [Elusimicrobia bacterium]|nr:hypothetical protein [Elusimicrobiota bacterium]